MQPTGQQQVAGLAPEEGRRWPPRGSPRPSRRRWRRRCRSADRPPGSARRTRWLPRSGPRPRPQCRAQARPRTAHRRSGRRRKACPDALARPGRSSVPRRSLRRPCSARRSPSSDHADRPASSGQDPGRHEPVAAVVAGAGQHAHRHRRIARPARGDVGDGPSGPLHQFDAGRPAGDASRSASAICAGVRSSIIAGNFSRPELPLTLITK